MKRCLNKSDKSGQGIHKAMVESKADDGVDALFGVIQNKYQH